MPQRAFVLRSRTRATHTRDSAAAGRIDARRTRASRWGAPPRIANGMRDGAKNAALG